jgi:hypothetical protein
MLAIPLSGCFGPKTFDLSMPAKQVPTLPVEPGAVPDDKGRVILDATPQADVEEIVAQHRSVSTSQYLDFYGRSETVRYVCTTPCAADLPRGNHRLRFVVDKDTHSEFDVAVGARPTAFRANIGGEQRSYPLGPLLLYSLGAGALTGLGYGAIKYGLEDDAQKKADAGTMAIVSGAVAGGLLAIGLLVDYLGRGEVRRGSSVQWTP